MVLLDAMFLVPATMVTIAAYCLAIYCRLAWGLVAFLVRGERLRETGGPRGKGLHATFCCPCGSPAPTEIADG